MYPILLQIGPFTLHTYGFFVALGFLAGYFFVRREMDKRGLSMDLTDQLVFFVMVAGILGARFFYFGVVKFTPLFEDPLSFFRIWEGGLVYYGAMIFGLGALFIYSKWKEIPVLVLGDALFGPLLLAHAIGRLGCFSAGCCYGKPTDSIFGVTFTHEKSLAPLNIALHPTQLYSALGLLALFFIVMALGRVSRPKGFLVSFYLVGYGTFRFLIEFLRGDFRGLVVAHLHPSQWISLFSILTGIGLFIYVKSPKNA